MKSQIYNIQIVTSNFGPGFINVVVEISRDPHYNDREHLDTHIYDNISESSFHRLQRAQLSVCKSDFWIPPSKSLNPTKKSAA